ncbi:hypothetical protein Leryth_005052 [Lithospermum erythrorhizon]|nr:hypothetical protein Leryth_005052 [Lithospermum erythrorhizon]
MAKKRKNKNNKYGSAPMELDTNITSSAMDTTESSAPSSNMKIKRGVQMKRSKNVRKMKAIAKAISKGEKKEEKIIKNEGKKSRTKTAKNLYH